MSNYWYLMKVLPGKERQLTEQFNIDINNGKIKYIKRFICPTEKQTVKIKNKKTIREKVIYTGYLYFESKNKLTDDELKTISLTRNVMGLMGDKIPKLLKESDVKKIIKDDVLEEYNDVKSNKLKIGNEVLVIDGPFSTFNGVISEINENKITVEIMIFGRTTTIVLSPEQMTKKI